MPITKTKKLDGEIFHLSGVRHFSERTAEMYANDLRRSGYKARVVGDKKGAWYTYSKKKKK